MDKDLCLRLLNVPQKEERDSCRDEKSYICRLTRKPCVARVTEEINTQPSHYSPEDFYLYDQELAKKCPALKKYGVVG